MEYLASLFEGGRVGWTMLGIAALVLAVSALILARLRWIQSRPIATCVVLSIVAHVLLVFSAYLTRMFDVPRPPGDGGIRIRLAETSPVTTRSKKPSPAWDKLAIEPAPTPQWTPLPPPTRPAPDALPKVESLKVESLKVDTAEAETGRPKPPVANQADLSPPLQPAPLQPEPISEEAALPSPSLAETPDRQVAPELAAEQDEGWGPSQPAPPKESTVNASIPRASAESSSEDLDRLTTATPAHRLPPRYRARMANDRDELVRRRGGSADTEAAVRRSLEWLARNQESAGNWDASVHGSGRGRLVEGQFRGQAGIRADTGMTGLALLAFLGAGNTHQHGKFENEIANGLEFIIRHQTADGNLAGPATNYARMYCHGIATLAICEALAMTDDERLRPFVERAVAYTLASQHSVTGGWRYHPGEMGDTSQFGWQLMALMSADQAQISIPAPAIQGMHRYLLRVSHGVHGGLASYRPGQGVSRSMTAEAMACRAFLGGTNPAAIQEASAYIREELPGDGRPNLYYWYYATLALSQTESHAWRDWNAALKAQLLPAQRNDGKADGSWDPDCVWGANGGRVYSTALAALCLEVYYRYPLRDDAG